MLSVEVNQLRAAIEAHAGQDWVITTNQAMRLIATIDVLESALRPFAESGAALDETDRDDSDAWEHHCAMAVKIGDFRRAALTLARKEVKS